MTESDETTECAGCGVRSTIPQAFRPAFKSFRLKPHCPKCIGRIVARCARLYLFFTIFVVVVVMLSEFMDQSHETDFFLWNLLLIGLFETLLIIPHELGHALVGRLLGFRVFRITIGMGSEVITFALFGTVIEIRWLPFGGVTFCVTPDTEHFKIRGFATVLAGPLVSLILLGIALVLRGGDHIPTLDEFSSRILWLDSFIIANLIVLIVSLIPIKWNSAVGELDSDGLQLLKFPFLTEPEIEERLAAYYQLIAEKNRQEEDFVKAKESIAAGMKQFPNQKNLLNHFGVVLLNKGEYGEALPIFRKLLDTNPADPVFRALVQNNIAYAIVTVGEEGSYQEAGELSFLAYRALPWMDSIATTRAVVLIETGKAEEGLPILLEAMQKKDSPRTKSEHAFFIAKGYAQTGDIGKAVEFLEEARRLNPENPLLERTSEILR